jgi:polysaccharide biosynthesis protein PslG
MRLPRSSVRAGSGRSARRRLLAAVVSLLLVATIASGCDDKESTTGDGGGRREVEAPPNANQQEPQDDDAPTGRPSRHDGHGSRGEEKHSDDSSHRPRDDAADDTDGAGGQSGGRPWPRFGVVYHGMWDMTWPQRAELLDKLVATGVTWVRIGIPWATVQPNPPTARDPGWGMGWGVPKADRVISQAVSRGLEVSATLGQTPSWANGGRGADYLPSDPTTYAHAIRWLAHRYRDKVMSWEIYNEPNNDSQLITTVHEYVRLLCEAYPAVHAGDPTTRVLFGGTSGVDAEFIGEAYERGAEACFDTLAVHPYNGEYSPTVRARSDDRWWWRNIDLVRAVMRRHGDLATPVWFTEYGWSSHSNSPSTPSWERGVSYAQQARYAVQFLRLTRRHYPFVDRVAWYSARNETNSSVENNNFGLFTLDLTPKPVALRLREFLASH